MVVSSFLIFRAPVSWLPTSLVLSTIHQSPTPPKAGAMALATGNSLIGAALEGGDELELQTGPGGRARNGAGKGIERQRKVWPAPYAFSASAAPGAPAARLAANFEGSRQCHCSSNGPSGPKKRYCRNPAVRSMRGRLARPRQLAPKSAVRAGGIAPRVLALGA